MKHIIVIMRSFLVLKSNRVSYFSFMYKHFLLLSFLIACAIFSHAQKPKDGTYTYGVAYDEWGGKTLGSTCTVIIKGDSVTVLHNGLKNMTGKKGDILDKGILMIHIPTGKWIIGRSPADKKAEEVGGCAGGPAFIDFKKKRWHTC